jgi:hypothetical protein
MSITNFCHSGGPPLWDAAEDRRPVSDQLVVLVESDKWISIHGHPVDSEYVEWFWLPVLGPSAIWMLRRMVLESERIGRQVLDLSHSDMSAAIGIQTGPDGPPRSWFRVLGRLERFRVTTELDGGVVRFPTHLPDLSTHQRERLPDLLRARHGEFVNREVAR